MSYFFFRKYDKEKAFAMNKYTDEAIDLMKMRLHNLNATAIQIPEFSIYSVSGLVSLLPHFCKLLKLDAVSGGKAPHFLTRLSPFRKAPGQVTVKTKESHTNTFDIQPSILHKFFYNHLPKYLPTFIFFKTVFNYN